MDDLLKRPYAAFSNKGAKKYVHEGRMYVKNRDLRGTNRGKLSAECDQRAIGCKGRAWFYEEGQFIKMVSEHGCEANPSHIAVTAIRNEEKRLATTTTMRTGEILAQVRNKARTSGVQGELPRAEARKRGIRRARTDSEDCKPPAIPTSLESVIIPFSYQVYEAVYGRDPDKWLLADSAFDKAIGGRIFVFGRKSYTQWMATVKKVFVDGTFRISPPLFEQVFVVLAKRNEYVFPIATALLPNKRAVTYRKFFQMVHDVFPQLNPQGVSCDYELAIQNAARGEWEGVSIDGCYWHLCSNLYKHLEQEGLSAQYDSDAQFAHECRKIVALACVPISHLDECFTSLRWNLPAVLSPILDWFENYYLGPMQPDGVRKTARFPIDSWNLVERIENGENRTNNYAEAHHRKVACELGVCHPNLWRFIDSMKLVQRGVDEAYSEMVLGHAPPVKLKKYRMADERMLALVKKAVKAWSEIVPMDYLSGIAYNFRMAQGPYQFPEAQDEEELLIVNERVPENSRNHAEVISPPLKKPRLDSPEVMKEIDVPLPTYPWKDEPSKIKLIKGDNNCFYRCIACLEYKDEEEHERVRREMMAFLLGNKHHSWIKYFGGADGVYEYARKFSQLGEWGSSMQLILASKLYNTNFILYQPDQLPRFVPFFVDKDFLSGSMEPRVGFIRFQGFPKEHFDVAKFEMKEII